MKFKSLMLSVSLIVCFLFGTEFLSAQTVSLTSPSPGSVSYVSDPVMLAAEIMNPSFLHVTNSQTGFRKLKIGYHPVNLYSPMVNVISGGNTMLEITLCNFGGAVDWTRIQIRPQGNSLTPVILAPYVNAAGGIGNSWKTISIPLSAFNTAINFSQISLLELPYSSGAGTFDIGISRIAFTGGNAPFLWFGPDHTSNIHNGNGGSGEVVAQLVTPVDGDSGISRVDFYAGNDLLDSDAAYPYSLQWLAAPAGNYNLSAIVQYADGSRIVSPQVNITVTGQPVTPYSIRLIEPVSDALYNYPAQIPVSAQVDGFNNPDPAWLHVTNTLTGYRKLKIGFNPSSLYTPFRNVLAGGNNTLEITMKDIGGNTNWTKIQIRPQGSSVAPVSLAPFVIAAGGIANEWKTISIPLTAFDPSVNFSMLSLIELPYSLSAGILDLGIQSIIFTGGSAPFVWFGGAKTDNSHNGNGGAGELVAAVIPSSPGGPGVDHVDFMANDILINTDNTAPFEFVWSAARPGNHVISLKLTDMDGLTTHSTPVPIQVNEASSNSLSVTITFDAPPANLRVEKAALRYNKDFAYSFTLDDGLIDAYTVAFPLLRGGWVSGNNTTYPGYFYSDGCGNAIPFSAGLSWYSVNSSGNDLHVNTPGYVNWSQLTTMHAAGWNVYNHSYSHAAYGTTDYEYQIVQNQSYVKTKSGIDMAHFVVPSGDQGYVAPAFSNAMLTVNGNNGAYRGAPNGYRIDQPLDYANFTLYKMLVSDANQNTANIMQKINNVAAMSTSGQHYWWSDFTHHVGFQASGASLLFPLYQYYMENIAMQYGLNGADNIWMAPTQDVYEYLAARDKSQVSYSLDGNTLTITVDYSAVPANLRTNALTLAIESDQDFNEASIAGGQGLTFNGTGNNKIVNLQWAKTTLKSSGKTVQNNPDKSPAILSEGLSCWPNPFNNQLNIRFNRPTDGETTLQLINLAGKIVFSTTVYALEGESQLTIDCGEAGLDPGMYFLKSISKNNLTQMIKILKIKP